MFHPSLRSLPILFLLLVPGAALAQITTITDETPTPGVHVGHGHTHLLSETVNPAKVSVRLQIHFGRTMRDGEVQLAHFARVNSQIG